MAWHPLVGCLGRSMLAVHACIVSEIKTKAHSRRTSSNQKMVLESCFLLLGDHDTDMAFIFGTYLPLSSDNAHGCP